ncbi:hypothetical protein G5B00_07720 [Parapedobacter sp. SGR-10]|uniref:fimbrillin family protein n=1 Tax=Parapedobacter sp. SGR-10 TaxID=2710879 RepID=UPI0013D374C5|nr:fimbrillin family protein [Parapedobacter sp. SGR-10]NGF56403.1 hypothetical protein [Parapedobacter sp. SGR-10]
MRGEIITTLFIVALSMIGCQKNLDNNSGLEFDALQVNFGATSVGRTWAEGNEIGIYGFCTRNGEQDVRMSTNTNARYVAKSDGGAFHFAKVSDGDQIIANKDDHNFRFHAYFPYSASNSDMSALSVQVPARQLHATGVDNYGLYVASTQVSTVVPTINLDFKSVFSTVELYLPNDIIDEDGNSVVRSLTLKPAVPDNFSGVLADGGTYNLETGTFSSNPSLQSDEIELDFGTAGIVLTSAFTKVSLAVAPFTIPEGGMDVVLSDLSGNETIITILDGEEGTVLAAGQVLTEYLSRDNDGIIPVNFPVVFSLGLTNGDRNFTAVTQPRWVSDGIWTCPSQTQAYAQWYKVSDPAPSPLQFKQFVNTGAISSPEIRGIWTGDYLEFTLPVKRFAAGTAVTIKFPMYTRQGPVFWNIEYFDEGVWKSNKTNVTSYDPAYTRQATFSLIRGGKIIEHTMIFAEAIQSGHVKIRITCADGSIQADTDTKVAVRTTPWVSSGTYGAPFYLYLADSDVTSITFSTN